MSLTGYLGSPSPSGATFPSTVLPLSALRCTGDHKRKNMLPSIFCSCLPVCFTRIEPQMCWSLKEDLEENQQAVRVWEARGHLLDAQNLVVCSPQELLFRGCAGIMYPGGSLCWWWVMQNTHTDIHTHTHAQACHFRVTSETLEHGACTLVMSHDSKTRGKEADREAAESRTEFWLDIPFPSLLLKTNWGWWEKLLIAQGQGTSYLLCGVQQSLLPALSTVKEQNSHRQ